MYNLVVMETPFGKWLKECRKMQRLTQDQLSEKSGVSASYISTLERNQPHSITGAMLRPEPDKVEMLAKALNEDIDFALNLAGYTPKSDDELVADGLFSGYYDLPEDRRELARKQIAAIISTLKDEDFPE